MALFELEVESTADPVVEKVYFDSEKMKFHVKYTGVPHLVPYFPKIPRAQMPTVEEDCSKATNHLSKCVHPNTRFRRPKTIRILLGHACNFRCKYCSQEHTKLESEELRLKRIEVFLDKLLSNVDLSSTNTIQFWGGETLLYWPEIVRIVDRLKEFTKGFVTSLGFSIISNGSLLTREITDRILAEPNMAFMLSHDGPGQSLRGTDPLREGFSTREYIMEIFKNKNDVSKRTATNTGRNFSVNPVLSSASDNLGDIHDYFFNVFGEDVPISECMPVIPIQPGTEEYAPKHNDMREYEESIVTPFLTGKFEMSRFDGYNLLFDLFKAKILDEDFSINATKSICFTTDPYMLTVDVNGDILPCQTYGSTNILGDGSKASTTNIEDEKHGNMLIPYGSLPTLYNWAHPRKFDRCGQCPVVSMCMGGCPYLVGSEHEVDCHVKFHHNRALMRVFMSKLLRTYVYDLKLIDVERYTYIGNLISVHKD